MRRLNNTQMLDCTINGLWIRNRTKSCDKDKSLHPINLSFIESCLCLLLPFHLKSIIHSIKHRNRSDSSFRFLLIKPYKTGDYSTSNPCWQQFFIEMRRTATQNELLKAGRIVQHVHLGEHFLKEISESVLLFVEADSRHRTRGGSQMNFGKQLRTRA